MNNEEKILSMLVELKESVDKRFDAVDKRLDTVDKRLDTVEERLDELDTRSLRSAVVLETEVAKKIQLLYEGQELLRQKMDELAPRERVEVLEDRVITLETLVKSMSKRLAALEKAQ